MDNLVKKQKLLLKKEYQGHHLIQACPTRWNSTLEMLARMCEQVPAVAAVANDPEFSGANHLQKIIFSHEEQAEVLDICKVLKPFQTATVLLSAETTVTISKVLPCLQKLEAAVRDNDNDPSIIKKLKVS
jgi:hypothetical protein